MMNFAFPLANASPLESWIVPAAGLAILGVTAALGYLFVAGRRAEPEEEEEPPASGPRPPNRRSTARRGGRPVHIVLADARYQEVGRGWVIDRSTAGLGVYFEQELAEGTLLNLCREEGMTEAIWVQVVVKNSTRHDDGWKLGCQFLQKPPWNVLLLFG
jgi:hypothetical protein